MHEFPRALFALALAFTSLTPSGSALADELPPLSAAGSPALDRAALVRAVLARNPSTRAAEAALRGAEARASAARSLADPMLRASLAPQSLWRGPRTGYRLELAQPLFAWGKRGLARRAAQHDAEATRFELAALRLDLSLAASQLYDEAFFAARSLALNSAHRALVEDLRETALARYEAGAAPQQAPLAAELEAARLEHREVMLRAQQRIARAQLNALLHRAADAELPPLPESFAPAARAEDDAREQPELRAGAARAEARAAEAALARRSRIPDVTLMGGYDAMWDEREMRPMLGVEVELPLVRGRRRAEVAEAEARRETAEHELARARSETELAVAIARERLAEAEHGLAIVREQILPAARDRFEAANAALAAGRGEFGDAIEAERAWYEAELEAAEALVALSRSTAALNRALGTSGVEGVR
jgi:outer membrane protein TolC